MTTSNSKIETAKKRKGGAPKKAVTQDKDVKLSFTEEVYDFLKYRAKVEGFATAKRDNISPYLRNTLLTMINEGRYEVVETSGISRELLIELTRIGINLNQAMHAMHSYGSENELVNLANNVELTRKVLLKVTNAITAPQKLPVATHGEAA